MTKPKSQIPKFVECMTAHLPPRKKPRDEFWLDYHCIDCEKYILNELYMVRDAVWKKAGMHPAGGCLCVGCIERRLGRKLTPKDFADSGLNEGDERTMTRRLLNRLGRRPRPVKPSLFSCGPHPCPLRLNLGRDTRGGSTGVTPMKQPIKAVAANAATTERPKVLDVLVSITETVISFRFQDRQPRLADIARLTSLASRCLKFDDLDERISTENAAVLALGKKLSVIT